MAKLFRNVVFLVTMTAGAFFLGSTAAVAQVCQQGGPSIGFTSLGSGMNAARNCNFGLWACQVPIIGDVVYSTQPASCDPTSSTCTVRATVPLEFPGFRHNTLSSGFFDSPAKLNWTDSAGGFAGSCGNVGARIQVEMGEAWIQVGGFSCADPGGTNGDTYSLQVVVCDDISNCEVNRSVTVNLTGPAISSALCPPPPKPWSCNESLSCQSGCMGPNGSGAGGSAAGGSSAAGGGPGLGGRIFGPGASMRYQAGGVGAVGNPLAPDWTTLLGRYWSHDYAERIVPDPDDSHVWLLTRHATFREFTDAGLDGVYETAVPSDEYRQLTKSLSGWELRELDGTIHAYDANGRWISTADRNGNARTATYDISNRLERVDFPDGRHELFAYDGGGRLATITEVGVDGTSTRAWNYNWTGDDLTGIDRPDGRSWDLRYDDPAHPGFITRLALIGDDGTSERIEGAWEYDSRGNVVGTWRGADDKMDAEAVDRWLFSFDDPGIPVSTTVTDPLGSTSIHTFGRDDGSSKPRLEGITGDCPTSCAGANSSTAYTDAAHPLRPTSITDGRGLTTAMTYDAFGQLTSRTEALGESEERTAVWEYSVTYPALVSRMERPSITGDPMDLRTVDYSRDANGNVIREIHEGVEDGAAFSFETSRTFSPEGMVTSLDGPNHSADDLVTMAYDTVDRGGLVLESRTDPLIGQTDYRYGVFNRRILVTDVNGVETTTDYDPFNRVRFVRQKGAALDGSEDLVTENRYTTFGDLFQVVLPAQNVIEYGYDAAGRLLTIERKPDDQSTSHGERTRYELNAFGQRILEAQERWEAEAWVEHARTGYEYATRCHLDKITAGLGTGEESVTEYAYDCNTNLEQIWDAENPSMNQTAKPSTTYVYDALDRLVRVEQPFGDTANTVTTSYAYDVQDHLVEVEDGEGTLTSYVYSDRDLMTLEISEVSGVTDYTYTDSGQLATKTDARGITETRSYDLLDRVKWVDYPDDTLDIDYVYDDPGLPFGIGRLGSITRDGFAIEYNYDRFGRTTQDGDLSYTYDQNSNRSTISYAGGSMSSYTFDFADREALLSYDDGVGSQSIVTAASYLPFGPLDGLTLGNGLEEVRLYDSRYFPSAIRVTNGLADLLHWSYTVDGVGNPRGIADVLTPANNRVYNYQDYQYFLTQGDGPWGTRAWSYDRTGNRLTEQQDGGFIDTYSYAPNAGMIGNSPTLDQITVSGGIRTFQYDAAGNQTQVSAGGNIIDRSYDAAGRMSRQERTSASAETDFLYDGRSFLRDAAGQAPAAAGVGIFCDGFESGDITAWGGGGSVCLESDQTGPLYDSRGLLHAVDGTKVLYFAGRPVAQFSAAPLFLTTDHLGTPIQATDGAAAVGWEGGFEPFGADYSGAQAAGVFLSFPGQWQDDSWSKSGEGAAIGYNVNRWYSHRLGSYTRPDPIGEAITLNSLMNPYSSREDKMSFYSYVGNNPLLYFDLLGLIKTVGCSPDQEKDIKKAFDEYCDLLTRDEVADCLDCIPRRTKDKLMKRCEQKQRQTVRCSQGRRGLCRGSGGSSVTCARSAPFSRWIRLCPDALDSTTPTCGPLGCTIMHELTHQIGAIKEDRPEAVERCFGCG